MFTEALVQKYLQEILPEFENCSRRAIESILDVPTRCPREFRISPNLFHPSSLACIIHSSNEAIDANLIVGVSRTDFSELLAAKQDVGELPDIIGETANVIAGNFISRGTYRERFGDMLLSPPLVSVNESSPRQAWSLQGIVMVKSAKLFVGFLVQSTQRNDPS